MSKIDGSTPCNTSDTSSTYQFCNKEAETAASIIRAINAIRDAADHHPVNSKLSQVNLETKHRGLIEYFAQQFPGIEFGVSSEGSTGSKSDLIVSLLNHILSQSEPASGECLKELHAIEEILTRDSSIIDKIESAYNKSKDL